MVGQAMVLAAGLVLSSSAWAQETSQPKKLTFAFKDASLEAVLLYVSQVTGWIFVQEAPARGTITAYSNAEVPVAGCFEFLNVLLRPHGLTARNPSWPRSPGPGETIRVLELDKAAPTQPGVHVGLDAAEIPVTDEFRTQIIPLKSVGAAEVAKDLGEILKKALGEGGQIAVSAYSNSILLTGRSEGIHRIAEILRVIDQTASAQLRIAIFPLAHADAVELVKTLNEICKREPPKQEPAGQTPLPGFLRMLRAGADGDRGAAARSSAHEMIRITAEPRTNSVIVSATEENLDLVQGLLRKLDRPEAALNTYVVPLINSDAATVASILNALWNGQGKSGAPAPNQRRSDGTLAPGQPAAGATPSGASTSRPGANGPRR
jgi:general secretion pathway protein D